MNKLAGSLEFSQWNRITAFVSQTVWLQRCTIRDNITFGQLFDAATYNAVLEACALDMDVKGFPEGDLTDVGEDGSRLSGGQKMRVSLARATYCAMMNPRETILVLLDDPFLSLDVHVANRIYHSCICGLLGNTTRILATHHTRFVERCTAVLNLRTGQRIAYGPPEQILPKIIDARMRRGTEDLAPVLPDEVFSSGNFESDEEYYRRGKISSDVLWFYVRSIGVALSIITVAAISLMQIGRTATDAWLAYYVSVSQSEAPAQLSGPHESVSNFFLGYVSLAVATSAFTLIRAFVFAYASLRGAVKLHNALLLRVLSAPMTFFERTPFGQVLNRLSSDVYTVDDSLPFTANILFAQSFSLIGTVVLICYGLPWILLLFLPLTMGYASVQRYYRWTSRELKRLSTISLSPLYSHLSESFAGAVTIRAFCAVPRFMHQLYT
ncbi:multidrug resistance-associated protein 7-like, partial [Tropilaelaps mercedesae]